MKCARWCTCENYGVANADAFQSLIRVFLNICREFCAVLYGPGPGNTHLFGLGPDSSFKLIYSWPCRPSQRLRPGRFPNLPPKVLHEQQARIVLSAGFYISPQVDRISTVHRSVSMPGNRYQEFANSASVRRAILCSLLEQRTPVNCLHGVCCKLLVPLKPMCKPERRRAHFTSCMFPCAQHYFLEYFENIFCNRNRGLLKLKQLFYYRLAR